MGKKVTNKESSKMDQIMSTTMEKIKDHQVLEQLEKHDKHLYWCWKTIYDYHQLPLDLRKHPLYRDLPGMLNKQKEVTGYTGDRIDIWDKGSIDRLYEQLDPLDVGFTLLLGNDDHGLLLHIDKDYTIHFGDFLLPTEQLVKESYE